MSETKAAPPMPTFGSLTASRDVSMIQRIIKERYGFTPSIQYCYDLMLFVEALTDGQQQRPQA